MSGCCKHFIQRSVQHPFGLDFVAYYLLSSIIIFKVNTCHGVLRHGVLCCGVLRHGVLRHGMLRHGVLCCAWCAASWCDVLCHGVLRHGVLCCGVLCCGVLTLCPKVRREDIEEVPDVMSSDG